MIYDKLTNFRQYFPLNDKFKTAFSYLTKIDLKNLSDGTYEISGKEIYMNVQTLQTKPMEEKKWEAHQKYIDIQYVISGEEKMGFGIWNDFTDIVVPYDEKKDVEFLNGDKYNFVDVKQGEFVIFYPDDVHAPMLAVDEPKTIKKVIVKIAI